MSSLPVTKTGADGWNAIARTPHSDFSGLRSCPATVAARVPSGKAVFSNHTTLESFRPIVPVTNSGAFLQKATDVTLSEWPANTATHAASLPLRSIDHILAVKSSLPVAIMSA